ncbi:MAG: DUF3006 domain-containing protein [Clostridium perfringens]|nr:DUF3006 domain-containing protein [Clostridium perfringens]
MNFWVIDRIESDLIICQDEKFNTIKISKDCIVGNLKEGNIIKKQGEKYILDEKKTVERNNKIKEFMKGMWQRDE